MNILSNIWVKIILAVGLVGGGAVGVSTVLNNKSADTESAASSSSSKKESKTESTKPAKTTLTPEQKLLVLMDNQKSPVGITATELRNGSYESSAMGPGDKTETITNMTVTPMDSSVSETVIASAPSKEALAFDVKPNRGGSMTGLLIEPDKSTMFMGQNFTGIEYDRLIQNNEHAVTMTNSEMEKYFIDHKKQLETLTAKISISGIDSSDKQTTKVDNSSVASKKETKTAANSEKKAVSDLSLHDKQALALMALPDGMYSDYGDITTEIILTGISPANGSAVNKMSEVPFDGVQLKQQNNKNLLYLANVDLPESMKNPNLYILGYFVLDGDNVTYKTQGMRVSWSNEDSEKMRAQGITEYEDMRAVMQDKMAQVKGTANLQDLYNKYKDDPKFEQMKNKVK